MDENTFNTMWGQARQEAANRTHGGIALTRFGRALWYGNNSSILGQHKGLTQARKDAPRVVVTTAVGLGAGVAAGVAAGVLAPVLLPFVPLVVVSIPLASGLLKQYFPTALKSVANLVASKFAKWGWDKLPGANPSQSVEQGLRKNVEKEVDELLKNTLPVIDRNIAKLNAAQIKAKSAADEMKGLSARTDKAYAALREQAEVWYYTFKVKTLVEGTQEALNEICNHLKQLDDANWKNFTNLEHYIQGHF